jgi:hypothetical protein
MQIPEKALVQYAVTQEPGAGGFKSLKRAETERLADFADRALAEFGEGALILFKHEWGHVAFKTKAGRYYPA